MDKRESITNKTSLSELVFGCGNTKHDETHIATKENMVADLQQVDTDYINEVKTKTDSIKTHGVPKVNNTATAQQHVNSTYQKMLPTIHNEHSIIDVMK